ncbi:putative serine/threonine protein phosphatase [Coemansia sp. Cherry 401B]|nr:putative serine/threonine protein phosphatase [Coemansia sp. Cherry 401B]
MKLDVDSCISRLYAGQLLDEWEVTQICEQTHVLLAAEPNVVPISAPVTVVGDVHGQFFDLLEIFQIGGPPPSTNYLFLGDYVDRGHHSVETISLLCALKLRYPQRIHLLRGNHESRNITRTYGFYAECQTKYGSAQAWRAFTDLFDALALAVIIDDSIFCVHGGLSPSIVHVDQLRALDRFGEIPHEGALADLVWSDPGDDDTPGFARSQRGAGFTFGARVVDRFLHANGMAHVLRAHQLCMEGYVVLFNDRLSTVWSAPNYCYRCGNVASVLYVDPYLQRDFVTFDAAPESCAAAATPAPAPDAMYFL